MPDPQGNKPDFSLKSIASDGAEGHNPEIFSAADLQARTYVKTNTAQYCSSCGARLDIPQQQKTLKPTMDLSIGGELFINSDRYRAGGSEFKVGASCNCGGGTGTIKVLPPISSWVKLDPYKPKPPATRCSCNPVCTCDPVKRGSGSGRGGGICTCVPVCICMAI